MYKYSFRNGRCSLAEGKNPFDDKTNQVDTTAFSQTVTHGGFS